MMPSTASTVRSGESCWTDEYLLEHCENYWVELETGEHVGVVDRVLWSEDGSDPTALLVHAPRHDPAEIVVPLRCVVELHPRVNRVVLTADTLADLSTARRPTNPA